jgi:hypothetical protein
MLVSKENARSDPGHYYFGPVREKRGALGVERYLVVTI